MILLNDFTTSIKKSLSEIDENWRDYTGLIVAGTHNPHDVENMINEIQKARENGTPFYGECFGHQLACIEWARNVMGIKNATSEEWGEGTFVVKKLPQLNVGLKNGESYWNNYAVIPEVEYDYCEKAPENMISAQFHASYQSSKDKPHPLLVQFIKLCKK